MLRINSFFSRISNRKDKDITEGGFRNINKKRLDIVDSQRKVHNSWDFIRRRLHRPNHPVSNANGDIHRAQQAALSSPAGTEPESNQIVGKVHSSLSITAIAQKQHDSSNQHILPTPQGELEDSASQLVDHKQISYPNSTSRDQVAGRRPSIEYIGTIPTKRISTNGTSKDGSRVSTKRMKKGEHDPSGLEVSAELLQAESRESQLRKEVDELKAELKIQENFARAEKAKAAQYMQQWEILQHEVQDNRRIQAGWKQAKEQQELAYREAIGGFDAKMRELQQDKLQLTSALRVKEKILAEYRNDIVKLSNERPDSKRDDHYFEQNFSQLFRSIHNWVLQYYLTVNPKLEDIASIHPTIQEFLTATDPAGGGRLALLQTEPLYVIQAYIASQVTSHILKPVLLGLMGDSYEKLYGVIATCAGAEELIKWRMSTINILSRREEFSKAVSTRVGEVANELVASLASLLTDSTSPQYKPGPRTKKLKAIVDQAAKLALETQQEPSVISYAHFEPATTCVASYVSDAKGLKDEVELQAMGTFVHLTVYPAVVRKPCNEGQEIVLVKAKVLAAGLGDL
ncbi:hypothetical protein EV426DRAFT_642646 [Tirmania nivea]|nr:hypothetical protein EV426DRAFT_642646 [Tirmania nivea]